MKKIVITVVFIFLAITLAPFTSVKAAFYLEPGGTGNGNSDEISPGTFTDINSAIFFNDNYQGLKWEFDFNEILINPLLTRDDGYGPNGYYATYLPFVSYPGGAGHYYKSILVKYNPQLFREINLILTSYSAILSNECDNIEDLMEKNLVVAIGDILIGEPDKISAIYSLIKYQDINELANLFVQAYISNKTTETFEGIDILKQTYDIFISNINIGSHTINGVLNTQSLKNAAVIYLNQNFGSIFSEMALEMAFDLFASTVAKYFPITGSIIKAFKYYRQYLIYRNEIQLRQEIINDIKKISYMLDDNPRNWGINLRLDFIVDTHNILPRNVVNNPTTLKNHIEQNKIITVLITPSNTDGFYIRPYNHKTVQESIYNNQTNGYQTVTTKYFSPKGNVVHLNGVQIKTELKNAIHSNSDDKPRKLSTANNAGRYFKDPSNPERVNQTVDTNKYVTLNSIGNAPELITVIQRYVTGKAMGLTVKVNDPYNTFVKTSVYVCKGLYNASNKCNEGLVTKQSFSSSLVNIVGLKPQTQYHYFITLDYINSINQFETKYFVYYASILTTSNHIDTPNYALSMNYALSDSIKVSPYIIKGSTANFTILNAQLNVYLNNGIIFKKDISNLDSVIVPNLANSTSYVFEIVLTYRDSYNNVIVERSYLSNFTTAGPSGSGGPGGGGTYWFEQN